MSGYFPPMDSPHCTVLFALIRRFTPLDYTVSRTFMFRS
jgi:hypothetical protein